MCGNLRGKSMVCKKNGVIGCGQDRKELKKFAESEIGDNPECVPDPCSERDGTLEREKEGQKRWHCACSQKWCFDTDQQPCPNVDGLNREKDFLPLECESCKCEFSATGPPKVNKLKVQVRRLGQNRRVRCSRW